MPPKKISKSAQLDADIQDYTAGQAAAKRRLQGMGGHVNPKLHDHDTVMVAYDALVERGDAALPETHKMLDLSLPGLFEDGASKAYRQGYFDGFKARVRKLAYPGQRIGQS